MVEKSKELFIFQLHLQPAGMPATGPRLCYQGPSHQPNHMMATRSLVKFTEGHLFPVPVIIQKNIPKGKDRGGSIPANFTSYSHSRKVCVGLESIWQTVIQILEKLKHLLLPKVIWKQKAIPLEHFGWSKVESKALQGHFAFFGEKGTDDV